MGLRVAALAVFLALAACGGETQQEAAAPVPSPSPPAATATPAQKADASKPAKIIPAGFLGVWDAGEGPCDPFSDMRLEIAPTELAFYESGGRVTGVRPTDGGDVLVTLAMAGEEETWTETLRLQLTEISEREALLVLHEPDDGVLLRPIPRFRCAE